MPGMLWNVTNCNGKKNLLGPERTGLGPRRQDQDATHGSCRVHPGTFPGGHGQSHPTSHSRGTIHVTLGHSLFLPLPCPWVGPLCPPGVSLHLIHLSLKNSNSAFNTVFRHLLSWQPFADPTPPPPDSHTPVFISNTAILQRIAMTCVLACLSSPPNCKYLRVV